MDRGRTGGTTTPRRRRRPTRFGAALAVLALVAAACGGDSDGSPDAAATSTTAPEPSGVQELVVGAGEDPWVDSSEGDKKRKPNYPLNADVCETLVQLTADFSVAPMVTEAEYVGDNTFEFTLVDDVTFSDGTPVTSAELKYSVDYTTMEPAIGSGFLGPESTTIVDERTIRVTPTRPNLRLIEQINHPSLAILKTGSDPLNDVVNSTCTGPFKVQSYAPEEQLVVVRNDDYWGDKPFLDKITFRFYPDETTRALALQNDEVDLIMDVPLSILSSVEAQPGVKIARAPVGFTTLFYVARRTSDGQDRALADPLVRRAVAASIDREAYVNGVLAGNAEVIPHIAPPAVLGDHADLVEGVPFDTEEAGRLLDQSGWTRQGTGVRTKDGQPLTIKIVYDRVELTTAEFVQAQLRAVGFDAQVAQLDAGAYRTALDTGDYDLDISVPNQNDGNPAFLLALRWYSKATGANAQIISPGPGTEFERMIDEILVEEDPEELRRRSAEAMHELVDNEVGGVTLAGGYRVYAMKDKVHGFEPHPSSTNQRWRTVYISE
ncbi:MAG: ABC transporter substrate-binding protein [Acidimicrobiia bacterium]